MSINQFLEDEFDAGEIEKIVRIDQGTGRVDVVRSQPMEGVRIPNLLSDNIARVLRDKRKVREGMGE